MKPLILLFILLYLTTSINAQYWYEKTKYDYKEYSYQEGDPIRPIVAGFSSAIIPGLGQMVSGKVGRGAAYLGGFFLCVNILGAQPYDEISPIPLMALGGMLTIYTLSIIDAVEVAKYKNYKYREKEKKLSLDISIAPSITPIHLLSNNKFAGGLSLSLTF